MSAHSPQIALHHPPGFRPRRGLNWVALGLLYASYYMCRYNFRFATPHMIDEFHFSSSDISNMLAIWSLAYGTGQLVNGLFADVIGGKRCLAIGAAGTVAVNLLFGFGSFAGTFSTFSLIWLFNGYLQAFGAPGMVKINAAWFHRKERGTFAGIYGLMIQLGQVAISQLAPVLLAGFTVGTFIVAEGEWRWLFRVPPLITAAMTLFMVFAAKETPDEAGYPGVIHDELDNSAGVKVSLAESFRTIFTHPLVWFYAAAYACTGAVRQSSDQIAILYFKDELGFDMKTNIPLAAKITLSAMPMVAVAGSFLSGFVSDKFFKGRRSPVAMTLYIIEATVIATAALVLLSGAVTPTPGGIFLGCLFLVLIAFTANSTHSIVGAAAPMDIGGKKMAGFVEDTKATVRLTNRSTKTISYLEVTGKAFDSLDGLIGHYFTNDSNIRSGHSVVKTLYIDNVRISEIESFKMSINKMLVEDGDGKQKDMTEHFEINDQLAGADRNYKIKLEASLNGHWSESKAMPLLGVKSEFFFSGQADTMTRVNKREKVRYRTEVLKRNYSAGLLTIRMLSDGSDFGMQYDITLPKSGNDCKARLTHLSVDDSGFRSLANDIQFINTNEWYFLDQNGTP